MGLKFDIVQLECLKTALHSSICRFEYISSEKEKKIWDAISYMDSLLRDEGLLDIDLHVKKLHEILMKNTKMVTPPGEFSVLERMAKETPHVHPRFFTTGEVYECVLGILDTFNHFYV